MQQTPPNQALQRTGLRLSLSFGTLGVFARIVPKSAFLFFLLVASLACAAPSASDALVVEFWEHSPYRADINKIPPEHRQAVIERLREIAARRVRLIGTVLVDELTAARVLIRIGDEQFIQGFMESFRTGRGRLGTYDMLTDTRQPLLIPYLVACVAHKDFKGHVDDDIIYPSLSGVSARTIPKILATTEAFSERTRTAAKSLILHFPDERVLVERIQAWWRDNEIHFRDKDYNAVTPIPTE